MQWKRLFIYQSGAEESARQRGKKIGTALLVFLIWRFFRFNLNTATMTTMFKVFKEEVHHFFHLIGENQGMRVTGDCTPAFNHDENN